MTPSLDLDFAAVAPIAIVGIGAMVVLMLEIFLAGRKTLLMRPLDARYVSAVLAAASSAALVLAIYFGVSGLASGSALVFNPDQPMVRLDRFASFGVVIVSLGALLGVWLSVHYLVELRINHGEYYALLLLATSGMLLMICAVDLVTIFLGLEIMSIPIYVLAGFDRRKLHSNESALKYFLIGSFASGLMLYGMALLYGVTGATSLAGIRAGFSPDNPLGIMGLGLVVVGFAFKVSSVPFHQWTPDVYEGAPTSVTAYMSVTVKAAAFLALLRFLFEGFETLPANLNTVLWVLAALTMVVGNVTAVVQDNVKRMLAYSSIGHAGYLLLGFVAGSPEGQSAVLFYLFAYLFMNLGAFGVIVALASRGRDLDHVQDFAGLATRRPGLAALMALFMIALAGIPGTVGFVAKFTLFAAAVKAGYVGLTVVAVLTSVVSVYFYLRLPVMMYMREPADVAPRAQLSSLEAAALATCAVAVVLFGLFPNLGLVQEVGVLGWARESVAFLR